MEKKSFGKGILFLDIINGEFYSYSGLCVSGAVLKLKKNVHNYHFYSFGKTFHDQICRTEEH